MLTLLTNIFSDKLDITQSVLLDMESELQEK